MVLHTTEPDAQHVVPDEDYIIDIIRIMGSFLTQELLAATLQPLTILSVARTVSNKAIVGQWSPFPVLSYWWKHKADKISFAERMDYFGAELLKKVVYLGVKFLSKRCAGLPDKDWEEPDQPFDPIEPNRLNPYSSIGDAICEVVGIAASVVATMPLTRLRVHLRSEQLRKRIMGFGNGLKVLWQRDGFNVFFRGAGIVILQAFLSAFGCHWVAKVKPSHWIMTTPYLSTKNKTLESLKHSIGVAADDLLLIGALICISAPCQTVFRKMEVQWAEGNVDGVVFSGTLQCVKYIYLNEGLSGFFKGLVPHFMENAIPTVGADFIVNLGCNLAYGLPAYSKEDDFSDEETHYGEDDW